MSRDLQLLGRARRTHDGYLREVRKLACYFKLSPDQLSQRQVLRNYWKRHRNARRLFPANGRNRTSAAIATTSMNGSSQTIIELASGKRFIGSDRLGFFGALHTWGRDFTVYNPHVHFVVPGGGVSTDGSTWKAAPENFLLPETISIPCNRCGVGTMHLTEITDGDGAVIYRKPLREHSVTYLDSG